MLTPDMCVNGTPGDFIITASDAPDAGILVSFAVKRDTELRRRYTTVKYQAAAELLSLEQECLRTVPVFLTDLVDSWYLFYRSTSGAIQVVVLNYFSFLMFFFFFFFF